MAVGRGECRCDIGIGVSGCETAWQGCLMCALRWVFPLGFWRKSRKKRSFWRLDVGLLEEVSSKPRLCPADLHGLRLRGAVPLGSAKHAGVDAACRW